MRSSSEGYPPQMTNLPTIQKKNKEAIAAQIVLKDKLPREIAVLTDCNELRRELLSLQQ